MLLPPQLHAVSQILSVTPAAHDVFYLLFCCCSEIAQQQEGRVYLGSSSRSIQGSQGSKNLRQLATLHQKMAGSTWYSSAHFLLPPLSGIPDQGMILPIVRMELPTLISMIKIIPGRHSQRLILILHNASQCAEACLLGNSRLCPN